MTDYLLCGWRVQSELPLPELLPWGGDARPADIRIRFGAVPTQLPSMSSSDPHGCFAPDGTFLTREASTAFLVDPDCGITVETTLEPACPNVRAIFYGTVLGVLCHRRGVFPLHASCPVFSGRAVALAGRRDVGKSSLAAVLVKRGCALLADDVTPVIWDAAGNPVVLPGVACLRLPPESMTDFGLHPDAALEPAYGKAAIPAFGTPRPEPAPLAGIMHLRRDPAVSAPQLLRLTGREAVGPLYDACFRGRMAGKIGLGEDIFRATGRLASDCPNYRLTWSGAPDSYSHVADLITRAASHEP